MVHYMTLRYQTLYTYYTGNVFTKMTINKSMNTLINHCPSNIIVFFLSRDSVMYKEKKPLNFASMRIIGRPHLSSSGPIVVLHGEWKYVNAVQCEFEWSLLVDTSKTQRPFKTGMFP